MWSGNVAVWSGNVAVAKSYLWNYLEHLQKRRSAKKCRSFGTPIFRSKGRNLAPF